MPLFSKKSKAKSSDELVLSAEDEVLAYLDEVFRKRLPLSIKAKGKSMSADIMFMDSKNKAMRMQMSAGPSLNGAEAMVGFSLDRTWWVFKSKLVLIQDKPHLLIPKSITRRERRKDPRTSFTAREQVKVTVMEGLGSGHGLFGMACDISPRGICITIEKCMVLSNEKEIQPSPTIYKPGAKLAFVKINKVPGMKMLETQGIAKRVFRDGSKWKCAIELDGLSKADRSSILRFIEPRVLDFKFVKRSMKAREEADARRAAPGPGPASRPSAGSATPAPPKASAAAPAPPQAGGGTPPPPKAGAATPAPPKPGAATPAPPAAAAPAAAPEAAANKVRALVIGSELIEEMPFLENDDRIEVLLGTTPVGLIRILTEDNPAIVLCGVEFKGRSSMDILERIANMGMSADRKIIVCAKDMQSKDRIRFKMMKVDDFVDLPVEDTDAFYAQIGAS